MANIIIVELRQFPLTVTTRCMEEHDHSGTKKIVGREHTASAAIDDTDGERRQTVANPDTVTGIWIITVIRLVDNAPRKQE